MTPTDFQIKPAFWLKEGTRANGGSDEDCAELTKPYQMASYFLRYQSLPKKKHLPLALLIMLAVRLIMPVISTITTPPTTSSIV